MTLTPGGIPETTESTPRTPVGTTLTLEESVEERKWPKIELLTTAGSNPKPPGPNPKSATPFIPNVIRNPRRMSASPKTPAV